MYQATTVTDNWAVAGIFYFFLGLYIPGEQKDISSSRILKLICDRLGNDVLVHAQAKAEGFGYLIGCRKST